MIKRSVLVAIPFAAGLMTHAIDVALPLWIRDMQANPFQTGLIGSVGGVAYIAVALSVDHVFARVNKKAFLIVAMMLHALAVAVMPSVPAVQWLAGAVLLQGTAMAMFWPVWQICLRRLARGSLTAAVGGFSVAIGVGAAGGSLVGGVLYEIDPRLPFYLAALISLGVGAFIVRFPSLEDGETEERAGSNESPAAVNVEPPASAIRLLWIARLANFGLFFCISALAWLFPFLARDLAISPSQFGVMMGVLRGTPIVVQFAMGRTEAWHDRLLPLLAAQALAIVGLAFVFFSSSTLLLSLAFALVGIGSGTTYFYTVYYSIHASTSGGAKTGCNEAIIVGGSVGGSFFGGLVAQRFTVRAPNLLCIGLVVGLGIVQLLIRRK